MKPLFLLFAMLFSIGLIAQVEFPEYNTGKLSSTLSRISVTATAGTPSFAFSEMGKLNFKKLSQISLGDLNISYKVSPRVSFGLSTMNNLSNSTGGYYNGEGQFFTFCTHEEEAEDNDTDDMDDPDDEDEGCEDDDLGNLLGTFTFKFSERIPLFIQAAGGYSFSNKAPSYSTMLGYNQNLFAGLGLVAGIRFSDVLYKKPADAVRTTSTAGIKAELGVSWNF